jgi:AcrR family transcriptional regulator
VRVFARQGFHSARVSDIADEAGVAYGLVYHYFGSKDEVLDTLFLERWNVLLEAIHDVDRHRRRAARQAAGDHRLHRRLLPPRPRPDEGHHRRGHPRGELVRAQAPGQDPRGLRRHRRHRAEGQEAGPVPGRHHPAVRRDGVLRGDRAGAHGWIFGVLPLGDDELEQAKTFVVETICGGLEAPATSAI